MVPSLLVAWLQKYMHRTENRLIMADSDMKVLDQPFLIPLHHNLFCPRVRRYIILIFVIFGYRPFFHVKKTILAYPGCSARIPLLVYGTSKGLPYLFFPFY